MNAKIILAILILSQATMACGFTFNMPDRPQVGPDVKESITVPDPGSEMTRLSISFGAGKLKLSPGAKNLVDGTVVYNVEDLKPQVIESGSNIEIKQGNLNSLPPVRDIKNEWDLQLGNTPMDLVIAAGAYEGTIELGGLSLKSLEVKDGASNVDLSFSKANPVDMSVLQYATGASDVKLTGLANANFTTMTFSGGAGNFTLDFGGDLQRDAVITVDSGFGNVSLIIPRDVNAKVTVESAAVNINHGANWSQNGKDYSQVGSGPTLTFIVKMAAGNLLISDD
ncbi:MAG: toast rack family protein [Syntrophothermus sp.]